MGARRNGLTGLAALAAFCVSGALAADAQAVRPGAFVAGPSQIDDAGFRQVCDEAMQLRQTRLVSLVEFKAMAEEPDTIVLDARSAEAFEKGHIAGAVNLGFADFTDEALADLISNHDTRILIYCNNNFSDDIMPVVLKRAPLALNIPTFINLYGYGYTNIYELGESVPMDTADLDWVGAPQTP